MVLYVLDTFLSVFLDIGSKRKNIPSPHVGPQPPHRMLSPIIIIPLYR